MSFCSRHYTLREYECFTRERIVPGYISLPKSVFDNLENFILLNSKKFTYDSDPVELLSISVRKNIGKVISARNYVGVITFNDGTSIEILPKITNNTTITESSIRKIFLKMLMSLDDIDFKQYNKANLGTCENNLFEIFIKMFLDEISTIIQLGIKSDYVEHEDNELYCKGKIIINKQVKINSFRKDRFYINFDEYSINRPENRLIKTTLKKLLSITLNKSNYNNIIWLLRFYDDARDSINIDKDFSECKNDRTMHYYEKALAWCRIFLTKRSFSPFIGNNIAIALLFPMEKIFECFIANKLRRFLKINNLLPSENIHSYHTQDRRYFLYNKPIPTFALQPDIVLFGKYTIVIDTKWKKLSNAFNNYGISQQDMYQMYVYGKKYQTKKIIIIYPDYEYTIQNNIFYESNDGVVLQIFLFNLLSIDSSLSELSKAVFE